MKKHIFVFNIVFICLFLTLSGEQKSYEGKEIIERSIQATRLAGTQAVAFIKILDQKGRERIRKVAQVTKLYDNGNIEKKLIRFLEPPDVKGVGFLTFDYQDKDDDKWLFMPALRKTRRIVSSENAKNFMGTEFTYADMTPPSLEDFTYRKLGEKDIDGTDCWEIEIVPVDEGIADENGFLKKISFIGKHDFVLRKALYYGLDGERHKELTVHEIKELDRENHRFRIMHMEMENKQNGRRSVLKVEEIQYSPNIKDDYFSIRYLERE